MDGNGQHWWVQVAQCLFHGSMKYNRGQRNDGQYHVLALGITTNEHCKTEVATARENLLAQAAMLSYKQMEVQAFIHYVATKINTA